MEYSVQASPWRTGTVMIDPFLMKDGHCRIIKRSKWIKSKVHQGHSRLKRRELSEPKVGVRRVLSKLS